MTGIIVDNTGDLAISTLPADDGLMLGISVGVNTGDIVERVLACVPGELKSEPASGVGLAQVVCSPQTTGLTGNIIGQLKAQGIGVNRVYNVNNEIIVDYDD
jgi:hypothetical protein